MAEMHADYQSTYRREDRRQRHLCACFCLWCSVLFATIFLICLTVGLRYTGSRDALTYQSSLGDSRLISYSPFLCSGGSMSIETGDYPSATMYFLDKKPPLSNWNIVKLFGRFVLSPSSTENDYYFYGLDYENVLVYGSWQFHLNPGSEIVVRSCVMSGGAAYFAVIQGNTNYNRWINAPSSYYYADDLLQDCGSGANPFYSLQITEEAYYYVVYYTSSPPATINLQMSINRTEYSTAGLSGMPNCTLNNTSSCNADSLSSSNYVLFLTTPPNKLNVTFVQSFTFDWMCDSRPGAYVFIFFFPLVVLALLFCGCFGIYCICDRCFCRTTYDELHEDHTHIHAKPVSEKPPPPYSAGPL